jgi:hypothetical protein
MVEALHIYPQRMSQAPRSLQNCNAEGLEDSEDSEGRPYDFDGKRNVTVVLQ